MECELRQGLPAMQELLRDCVTQFIPKTVHFYGHLFSFDCLSEDTERFEKFALSVDFAVRGLEKEKANNKFIAATPLCLNKGRALAEVARRCGLKPSEIVVAGDGNADRAMMNPAFAKFAVCPSNATDLLKEHVRSMGGVVSEQSNCDGVMDGFWTLWAREGWGRK